MSWKLPGFEFGYRIVELIGQLLHLLRYFLVLLHGTQGLFRFNGNGFDMLQQVVGIGNLLVDNCNYLFSAFQGTPGMRMDLSQFLLCSISQLQSPFT